MPSRNTFLGALLTAAGLVASASPATAASSTPFAPASISCRYEYTITAWQSGFTGTVKVTNTGTEPASDWRLEFDLTPADALVLQAWNGILISFHNPVRINAPVWGDYLLPDNSHEVGFVGEFMGANSPVTILDVRLNGVSCTKTTPAVSADRSAA